MRASVTKRYEVFFSTLGESSQSGIRHAEPMEKHTSFRIGGPADLFFQPPDIASLSETLAVAHAHGIPVTLIGGGTNVLVSDAGIRGLVVRLGRAFDTRAWIEDAGESTCDAHVGAATPLARFVREAVAKGLAGLEFAAGIPGSVGGGALMNAGAFGGEIGSAITAIDAVAEDGEILRLSGDDLRFSYRHLALDRRIVVTSVSFRLTRSSVGRLRPFVESVQEKRKRHQPLGFPNAGSIFKNPTDNYAGKLIERSGLKGTQVGRAQISPEHANFIVNLGGAKAVDVRALMGRMQEEVWWKSGIWLEPEVRLVGEWDVAEASS